MKRFNYMPGDNLNNGSFYGILTLVNILRHEKRSVVCYVDFVYVMSILYMLCRFCQMSILQNQHESTFSVKVWNVAVMELKQVFDFGYITRIGLSFIAFCSEFE